MSLSAVTVQDILNKNGLGTRAQRLYALERQHLEAQAELDEEQIKVLEKHNPCFRERHVESRCPGELLCADTSKACTSLWTPMAATASAWCMAASNRKPARCCCTMMPALLS